MILLASTTGKILLIAGVAIMVYGVFLGGGKKGNSKDNGKHYDKKESDPLMHAAKMADPDYAYKGSGRYKDSKGKTHQEK